MKVLIIGNGVAGHTAAETIRNEDRDVAIHVFTEEETPFYDRIGLRAYIRSGRDENDLILNDEDWYKDNDICLHLNTRVTSVDTANNVIETTANNSFEYDKLLIATGGTPRDFPGAEEFDQTHHLWYLEQDGRPLRQKLEDAEHGVVIGGGLLGFDFVGSFSQTDTETTYLIREQNWWPSVLDLEGAQLIHDAMEEHGINLNLEEEATSFEPANDHVRIRTNNDEYCADVVGIAIGNIANTELAEEIGLETNRGIIVDEHLQTGDPDIYAAGTVAEYKDIILEKMHMGGSWVTAQEQGKIAGKNMLRALEDETQEAYKFVDQYTVMHFGLNVASLGDPRHTADQEVITVLDKENSRYRKVVLEEDRILGAAIIGEMKWLYPLKQLIERKTDVSGHREDLENPAFDLNKLL